MVTIGVRHGVVREKAGTTGWSPCGDFVVRLSHPEDADRDDDRGSQSWATRLSGALARTPMLPVRVRRDGLGAVVGAVRGPDVTTYVILRPLKEPPIID